ncbi:triosephosphate isomerase 2 [Piedraia hortae CBS 480.64]|uniref:Triosephosphate isomerase n=1 Tax=Piedraia hortae CBS 480.64 TaxID=1314780 RepID=A0A6A7CBM1_9PEZI|nr:triosephosphate isomerase 2 [Piedraia hortae CBS 480.64]
MAPIPTPDKSKPLLAVSTKMYFDLEKTKHYTNTLTSLHPKNIHLLLVPDFLSLPSVIATAKGSQVMIGAQNCSDQDFGAYTGEVSPRNLAQMGVEYVEVGHAERRKLFGETDELIGKKVAAVVRNGMIPLICIGETSQSSILSQAVGMAVEECRAQVQAALKLIDDDQDVVFAYEPVWAIGADKPAGADHIVMVGQNLKDLVKGRKGRVGFLYGGSAGPGTWESVKDGVDGLFLGRFAHDENNLKKVVQEMGG